jgi:3-oxoacyl-[acyl-carrier protein] reductase
MSLYDQQTVIVTGGTRGIGAALTKGFLKEGAKVIATYASNDEAAEEFLRSLETLADQCTLKKFDVSDSQQVQDFFKWFESLDTGLEVLINNSGIRRDQMLAMMEDENWSRVLDVNLQGSFLMTKYALPSMLKNRYGRIINISSVSARLGLPGQANYAASKAAQVAMSQSLSKEVGKRGITVNNIAPGFIETELIADLPAEQVKEYKKQVPLRRFGKPEEVADAALFLASKKAAYITGTTLEISGGL